MTVPDGELAPPTPLQDELAAAIATAPTSRHRYRRAAVAAGVGVVAKATSILATAVGITLISRSYDAETLGIWVLLIGTVSLLGFADLGLGNGILNVVAAASGRDDMAAARRAISSAVAILTVVAVALGIAASLVLGSVSWTEALSAPNISEDDLSASMMWFVGCALVALPLAAAQRAQMALQEGWVVQLWNCLGSIASIGAIVWAVESSQPLAILVLAGLIGAPLACLGNSIAFFLVQHPELRPKLRYADRASASLVLRQGSYFFVIAILYALAYQTDSILVSHYLGADAVPTYAVPARIFGLVPVGLALLLSPLWPAHAESIERGDHAWAQLALRRSLRLAIASVPITVLLAFFTPKLSELWLGRPVEIPLALTASLALWTAAVSVCTPLSMFLNGARVIRAQLVMSLAMTIVNFGSSVVLVQTIGIEGPALATAVSQIALILIPSLLILRPMLRTSSPDETVRWLRKWSANVSREDAVESR